MYRISDTLIHFPISVAFLHRTTKFCTIQRVIDYHMCYWLGRTRQSVSRPFSGWLITTCVTGWGGPASLCLDHSAGDWLPQVLLAGEDPPVCVSTIQRVIDYHMCYWLGRIRQSVSRPFSGWLITTCVTGWGGPASLYLDHSAGDWLPHVLLAGEDPPVCVSTIQRVIDYHMCYWLGRTRQSVSRPFSGWLITTCVTGWGGPASLCLDHSAGDWLPHVLLAGEDPPVCVSTIQRVIDNHTCYWLEMTRQSVSSVRRIWQWKLRGTPPDPLSRVF